MSKELTPSEALQAWEMLKASDGWRMLTENLSEQLFVRQQRVLLTPLASADGVFEQEFTKGEIQAISLVMELPGLAIEALKQDAALNAQENENANE